MLDNTTRVRFRDLRNREIDNDLTDAERVELARLVRWLEDIELETIRPALEERERATRHFEFENEELLALVQREERIVARLTKMLVSVEAEQRAIASVRDRIMARTSAIGDTKR